MKENLTRINDLEDKLSYSLRENLKKDAIINKQKEKIKLLEQHVKFLDNKLRKYINENTPSSKKPLWDKKKSPDRINKKKKKLGKPKGSNGGTIIIPKIDEEKVVRLHEYESYLGEPLTYLIRTVGEIPPPQELKWTRYYLAQYIDPATGRTITATDPNCPKEGMFGPNLKALITILREKANISEDKTKEILEGLHGLTPASATIESELDRVATILTPFYEAIGKEIDNSSIKHSDETGQSVNGDNWCIYTFSTKKLVYYFAENKKRSEHIQSRLNDDWNKVLCCDGHSIYEYWYAKQRCWSHGTRKETWLYDKEKTDERVFLHETISGTFHLCKDILDKDPPGPHQLWNVMMIRNRMWHALNYKWKDDKCQEVANYMKNAWKHWFTFMFVEGVEPTNNLNERDVRKHVMKRKNSGTFRSESGLDNHCVILSAIETWRKNQRNPYSELVTALKQHNSSINWAN